tara:strand:+ start:667 stop:1209 length:543 start_codon:yes stop_codon:yes gene_type:complete
MAIGAFGAGLEEPFFGSGLQSGIFGPQEVVLSTSIRLAIINEVIARFETILPNRVFVNRRLPIASSEGFSISVDWSEDTADYSAGMLSSIPQRNLTLVVNIISRAEGIANPPQAKLDEFAVSVEEKIYTDQTFTGKALGVEISSYTQEIDNDGENTVGSIRMEFTIFYYAAEGLPKAPIT